MQYKDVMDILKSIMPVIGKKYGGRIAKLVFKEFIRVSNNNSMNFKVKNGGDINVRWDMLMIGDKFIVGIGKKDNARK